MEFFEQDTGEGCHFLLQETFLTQGSNPGLLHMDFPGGSDSKEPKQRLKRLGLDP